MTPDLFAAADPPEQTRRVDADSPWLGLLPFTEETQRFFFGRQAEVREIFLRVRDQPLTVLYGQSGYGKTSLLNAGLVPKLRAEQFQPAVLRLRFESDDPPLLAQVRAALAAVSANDAESVDALLTRWSAASLWECFHDPALRPPIAATEPPVLIFDQFEEVFTLGASQRPRDELENFAAELADLIENRPPLSIQGRLARDLDYASELDFRPASLRVIITLREDYLSYLETWKGPMPSLMRNRMALHLLRGPQALEAVVLPGRLDGRNLVSEEVGAQIVRVIARRPADTPLEEIEAVPPLLSLLCDELNRARDDAGMITAALVEQKHGDILQQFYSRCFDGFPPAVRRFVEDRLVTVGGHRNLVAREDAESELTRASLPDAAGVLDKLLERRLLSAEERGGTQRIEITHDVLAPLVTDARDKRLALEGRLRAEEEARQAETRLAESEAARIHEQRLRIAAEAARMRARRLAVFTAAAVVLAAIGIFAALMTLSYQRIKEEKLQQEITRLKQPAPPN